MIVAQLGARMHYAVPKILNNAGLLNHLYTDVYYGKGILKSLQYLPDKLLPDNFKRLKNRNDNLLPNDKISSYMKLGLDYYFKRRKARDLNERIDVSLWAGKKFNNWVLKSLSEPDHIYVFNSAGKELLEYTNRYGKIGFMEQTIAPRELEYQLLMIEKEKYPGWQESELSYDKVKDFAEREKAEWDLAHIIICGSDFVKEGIKQMNGPVDKCVVIPYGIDHNIFKIKDDTNKLHNKSKLNILTVGRLGLRKGTPAIINAARKLQNIAEFRMVGPGTLPDHINLSDNIKIVGPVPRLEVHQFYQWADVFLLPSVCEGSATVTYEALAYGLPTIVTNNTGSIIRNNLDGIMIDSSDADHICTAIESLYSDPGLLDQMSHHAYQRAAFGSLQAYENRLLETISETIKN